MAQRHQLGRIEKSSATLDGMKTAKDLVEQIAVIGTFLQIHQLAIDIGQHLARFHQEIA